MGNATLPGAVAATAAAAAVASGAVATTAAAAAVASGARWPRIGGGKEPYFEAGYTAPQGLCLQTCRRVTAPTAAGASCSPSYPITVTHPDIPFAFVVGRPTACAIGHAADHHNQGGRRSYLRGQRPWLPPQCSPLPWELHVDTTLHPITMGEVKLCVPWHQWSGNQWCLRFEP